MNLEQILLVCAALLPAIALCIYIYIHDRVEKEPVRLLMLLFLSGGIAVIFVMLFGSGLQSAENSFFMRLFPGDLPFWGFILYTFIKYFIVVGLVEETGKWCAMRLLTKNNRNFNSLFDGIVYAAFVSMGFAAAENIMYVLNYGWDVALQRAILSVPMHLFFSVPMGCFYAQEKRRLAAYDIMENLRLEGIVEDGKENKYKKAAKKPRVFSILVPVLLHGAYDFTCVLDFTWINAAFYALVWCSCYFCYMTIASYSEKDEGIHMWGVAEIAKTNPEVYEHWCRLVREENERAAIKEEQL